MKQRIQKVKKHFSENGELYFMYGCGIAAGVLCTKILSNTVNPSAIAPVVKIVDADDVLRAWHGGVRAAGKHVFLLNDAQRELWQNCLETAKKTAITNPEYVRGMAEGFRRSAAMGA